MTREQEIRIAIENALDPDEMRSVANCPIRTTTGKDCVDCRTRMRSVLFRWHALRRNLRLGLAD